MCFVSPERFLLVKLSNPSLGLPKSVLPSKWLFSNFISSSKAYGESCRQKTQNNDSNIKFLFILFDFYLFEPLYRAVWSTCCDVMSYWSKFLIHPPPLLHPQWSFTSTYKYFALIKACRAPIKLDRLCTKLICCPRKKGGGGQL